MLQCPHVPALCLNVNSENYFCQQHTPRLSPAINRSGTYQVANPGQTMSARTDVSLTGEKGGQPRSTTIPTASLTCGCGKKVKENQGRRVWTGFHPLDRQDGFACPMPTPKRGQSRPSSLAPTSSWHGAPRRRSVLGLRGHYLHCLLNKESQEYHLQGERCHIFTPDCSKCHVVTNIKIPRVSWNRFPSRDVLSTTLETFQSDLIGSSLEQPCLISQLALL